MKRILITALCLSGVIAQAQLIDSFSGDLSAYTATRILKATPAAANNVYSWEISDGALRISTSTYNAIEQFALTRTDFTLSIGAELTATYNPLNLNSQDIGLYVGAGTPTADVRADYLNVYVRNNGQIFTRGFNGTSEVSLAGGATPANISSLFIARTAADTFELGYYDGAIRNLLATRTVGNTSIGNAIGFYADIRGAGIRGTLDNLAIPEPSVAALLGVGAVAMIAKRRRQ